MKTNIDKRFLGLIEKHFPKNHRFPKIFNNNNGKVGYSCVENMTKIVNSHNKKVLQEKTERPGISLCNCRVKTSCPLNGFCLTENIVYKAEVSTNNNEQPKVYFGLCEATFKKRYANHKKLFSREEYSIKTELSNLGVEKC